MPNMYNKGIYNRIPGKKLRAAHLLSGREGGGILTVVLSLINHSDPMVIKTSILILSKTDVLKDKRVQKKRCHFIRKRFRGDFLVVLRIISYCLKNRIDILHTHSISSNFYGRLAGIFLNKTKVITSVHAWTHDELRGVLGNSRLTLWIHKMDLWMNRLSDQMIAVSMSLKNDLTLKGLPEDGIHVIPHGIEVEDFRIDEREIRRIRQCFELLPQEKIVGIVGRLTPTKNHKLFLRAARIVSDCHRNCRFIIVGDGPLRKDLESLARDLSLADRVIFTGWVERISPFLHLMNILVLTSQSEGFGYVLLEGMACGKPIVATGVSEIPRIICHGKTGFLVPPDDQQRLAKSIDCLLTRPELCEEMGKRGRETVAKKYGVNNEVEDTLSVYLQTLYR